MGNVSAMNVREFPASGILALRAIPYSEYSHTVEEFSANTYSQTQGEFCPMIGIRRIPCNICCQFDGELPTILFVRLQKELL